MVDMRVKAGDRAGDLMATMVEWCREKLTQQAGVSDDAHDDICHRIGAAMAEAAYVALVTCERGRG